MPIEPIITPEKWSTRGEANALVGGKPMRVWSGIVGERARVRVVHEGQHSDYAVYRFARDPSPHRVDPPCQRYHMCGGCPWMHMDGEGQLAAKRDLVLQVFADKGLEGVAVGPVSPCPDGMESYRWSVKLGVGRSEEGRLRVGAWGRRSRTIVPIPKCPVAADPVRAAMASAAHHILDLSIRPYDPETDEGVLRSVILRGSRSTGEVLVTLVAGRRIPALNQLADALIQQCGAVAGVALHLNDEPGNAIFSPDEEGEIRSTVLNGVRTITETIGGISYEIGPGDFFQTNPSVAEQLYAETLDRLELGPEVPVVDLYSGVGGMTLAAARRTGWAVGVEVVSGAVQKAKAAAKRQQITAEFQLGPVLEHLPKLAARLVDAHPVVIVNPARRGLEQGVIEGITELAPRRLAYVSCNPESLARDLRQLQDQGMLVESVSLYDMFPNTPHVESVAVLRPKQEVSTGRRAPRRRVVSGRKRS